MFTNDPFEVQFGAFKKKEDQNPEKISFIHASDIHLGSYQYRNEYRANDFIFAFQEILRLALYYQVDFILLGGDVFTSLEMLPGNLLKIVDNLKNFKEYTNGNIPIIAIEGNHDIRRFSRGVRFSCRGQSWLKLIANLGLIVLLDADMEAPAEKMFSPYDFNENKGGKIQIKNVIIYGNRYLNENPEHYIPKIKNAIKKDINYFSILLQHYGIEGQMKNVPGIKFTKVLPLKEKVDYLALGHYHLQFSLDGWIFNPGSSEAVCSADSYFKRGVFLVEVKRKNKEFIKNIKSIRLTNRKNLREIIHFRTQFIKKNELNELIIKRLKNNLQFLDSKILPSNTEMPILYLILKGNKPANSCKINEKEIRKIICEIFPVVDVKIYQKFDNPIKTLDGFIKVYNF